MGVAQSVSSRLIRMEFAIGALGDDMAEIKGTIKDRWRKSDMRHWAELLKANNHGAISVPDVDEPH